MQNKGYFQYTATKMQVQYAEQLVAYSMKHHPVANIWDGTAMQKRTFELRFTGSLGEVMFADAYRLPRPQRAFGAIDGQDWGKDFEMSLNGQNSGFDIKTMRRDSDIFYANYVLNIPYSHLHRPNSLTDYYFHISLHQNSSKQWIASFVGFVNKTDIKNEEIGIFYPKNSERVRKNGTCFRFYTDTYEVDLQDFNSPPITSFIRKLPNFKIQYIRPVPN